MQWKSSRPDSQKSDVRFQLSLLKLMSPSGVSERQLAELEGLLNASGSLAPSR